MPGHPGGAELGARSDGPAPVLVESAALREFTRYRIDRVPRYELIRCGLAVPEPGGPPYTGMPATGP